MKLITAREYTLQQAQEAIATHRHVTKPVFGTRRNGEAVHRFMYSIPPEQWTPEHIEAGIGYPPKGPECTECEQEVDEVIHFGHDPDYDSIWQFLCIDCLTKGLNILLARKHKS